MVQSHREVLTLRPTLSLAASRGHSVMVLFVDLVKAFDKAIRQLVYGWGPEHAHLSNEEKTAILVDIGVDHDDPRWMVQYIEEDGCVLDRWQADPKTVELAQPLHANAWFTTSAEAPAVTTSTGGRQGCKLGALTFNSHYAVALDAISSRLATEGITMRMNVPNGPFWQNGPSDGLGQPSPANDNAEDILDAAFLDDESMAITAPTPKLLDRANSILLLTVTSVFNALRLEINWSKFKTECI